jgi:hypothetical protein
MMGSKEVGVKTMQLDDVTYERVKALVRILGVPEKQVVDMAIEAYAHIAADVGRLVAEGIAIGGKSDS